jgi:SAM-dependent methyltransferase
MTRRKRFEAAYYRRFYEHPHTRVASTADTAVLVNFVVGYLNLLRLEIADALDLGCGLGWWRDPLLRLIPDITYTGVEFSEYLCRRLGWHHGSVVDYHAAAPADLVICQGVLQYLETPAAARAIENLARQTGQVLFLEVLTRGDWERIADQERTDGEVVLREVGWYREQLAPHFINLGGGLFLKRELADRSFELERCD